MDSSSGTVGQRTIDQMDGSSTDDWCSGVTTPGQIRTGSARDEFISARVEPVLKMSRVSSA